MKANYLARNATVFKVENLPDRNKLGDMLAAKAWVAPGATEAKSQGFVPPYPDPDHTFCRHVGDVALFAFRVDRKLLPSSVINEAVEVECGKFADQYGYAPGRKARREIKEQMAATLLAQAFTQHTVTRGWIDYATGFVVVDAVGGKAEAVIEALAMACPDETDLDAKHWHPEGSIPTHLTDWVAGNNAPDLFSIDDRVTLDGGEGQSIKVVDNNATETAQGLLHGRAVIEARLTFDDRVSFTLEQGARIKSISLIDIKAETNDDQAELMPEQRYDAEVSVSALTLRRLVQAITEAFN